VYSEYFGRPVFNVEIQFTVEQEDRAKIYIRRIVWCLLLLCKAEAARPESEDNKQVPNDNSAFEVFLLQIAHT
jgi:hypothetical protein